MNNNPREPRREETGNEKPITPKVSLTFTDGSMTITKEASFDATRPNEYATQYQLSLRRASESVLAAITGVYGDVRTDDPTSPAAQYCFELEDMTYFKTTK